MGTVSEIGGEPTASCVLISFVLSESSWSVTTLFTTQLGPHKSPSNSTFLGLVPVTIAETYR